MIAFPPPSPSSRALTVEGDDAPARPLATIGLSLFAVAIASEYRVRLGASAIVSELGAYLAVVLILLDRSRRRPHPHRRSDGEQALLRDAVLVGLVAAWLLVRAFLFRLGRTPDSESAFSHVRDVWVPLAVVLLVRARVRLPAPERRTVATALVAAGALCGAIGVSQFFRGWPYFYEGIDIVRFKTLYAQKYWIAEVLHMKVEHLARGLYAFSIAYAASLVVPSVMAFALAWGSRSWRGRLGWGAAFLACYAGIYFSFSRSILGVVPFGCFMAARAIAGRLRPLTCAALVAGYVGVALVGPLLHLGSVSEADIDTLNARVGTLIALGRHVARDPMVLLIGSTVQGWHEWNTLSPHNWAANALLADGLPGALLRIGAWLSLLVSLYPVAGRRRADPVAAGAWAGSFTLLFIVGETEPMAGIALYLVAACGLALAATFEDPSERASSTAWPAAIGQRRS